MKTHRQSNNAPQPVPALLPAAERLPLTISCRKPRPCHRAMIGRMTYESECERLIARTYDNVYTVIRDSSGDAAFYRSMAEEVGGPLLELGCGMRWYYRYELEHLLARAGFADVTFYRDFARTPWSSGNEIVVVARPQAADDHGRTVANQIMRSDG